MQGHLQVDELEKQLGLFKDEKGIIRCRGRLGNSHASYNTKCPALLSGNHHVTSLIIRYCQERVMHNGLKETLTEVRSKHWILKGRQTVKKELFACNIFEHFKAGAIQFQNCRFTRTSSQGCARFQLCRS